MEQVDKIEVDKIEVEKIEVEKIEVVENETQKIVDDILKKKKITSEALGAVL